MGKPYASKLPAKVRMEEITVGTPAMRCRSRHTGPPQNHLAYHELSVIFSNRPLGFFKSGIRQVGAFRPFPSFSPAEFPRGSLPFRLGRQTHSPPGRISHRFIIADMTNRLG